MIHVNYEIFFLRRVGRECRGIQDCSSKLRGYVKTTFSLFTLCVTVGVPDIYDRVPDIDSI